MTNVWQIGQAPKSFLSFSIAKSSSNLLDKQLFELIANSVKVLKNGPACCFIHRDGRNWNKREPRPWEEDIFLRKRTRMKRRTRERRGKRGENESRAMRMQRLARSQRSPVSVWILREEVADFASSQAACPVLPSDRWTVKFQGKQGDDRWLVASS